MEAYHGDIATSSGGAIGGRKLGPYEYVVTPAIERLLRAIRAHCSPGGTIKPGVRRLAEWADCASPGRISNLLRQLADDGWIWYDGPSGCITLCADPDGSDVAITAGDRDSRGDRHAFDDADDAPITAGDRDLRQQNAASQSDSCGDRFVPRMEDHVLVAAAETQDSAAALNHDLPCAAETITAGDRPSPAAQLLAELGADVVIITAALAQRPDLTAEQVRATWEHFEQRRRDGYVHGSGAFFKAIRNGQIHAAPSDRGQPIPVEAYIQADPAFYRRGDDTSDLAPPATAPPGDRPELAGLAPPPRTTPARPLAPIAPAYMPAKWQRDRRPR